MSFAYELELATLTEEESIGRIGRLSADGLYQAFREPQREQSVLKVGDTRLVEIETNEDYKALLSSERYTPAPTAAELERRLESKKMSYEQLANRAASNARLRYAADLPFQLEAYHLKELQAKGWDGTGHVPKLLAAAAVRMGVTPLEAQVVIRALAVKFRTMLEDSEEKRELIIAAANSGDFEGADTLVAYLTNLDIEG